MSKQYGLVLPGQQKKQVSAPPARSRPAIFDESSDSDGEGPPQLKMKNAPVGPGAMERRIARQQQAKALEEDPTIFQYDELYDDMESKRETEKQSKSNDPKKPKYIKRLLETAEKRKLENELRIERQVQKEREEEGEQFKDKESFVTSTYRKKLEELRALEEQEKRDEYLEAIGDVTKQKDLDGFYRHLYEQKMGTSNEVKKPELPNMAGDEEHTYKPIKSMKTQQRAYRKRQSIEEEEPEEEPETQPVSKKAHLQNNIDADSDFSIDSSSDEDDDEGDKTTSKNKDAKKTVEVKVEDKSIENGKEEKTSAVPKTTEETIKEEDIKKEKESDDEKNTEPSTPPPPKRDKTEIWKKRTVGDVFDAAVKRYFERKAARSA